MAMPQSEDYPTLCDALLDTIGRIAARHWCPATGGNFSARIDDQLRLITRSGRDKTRLSRADLMLCDARGKALNPADKPSDETALHARLYQLDSRIGAVLHTHSSTATVLSRLSHGSSLNIHGFEMQKAIHGQTSHLDTLDVPIFDNTQDIDALAERVAERWPADAAVVPALLVRGHGLYAWGRDLNEAYRHVEGLEFLFECVWQECLATRDLS